MRLVAYASRRHYADHLRPIVDLLPFDVSDGFIYGPRAENEWGPQLPPLPRRVSRVEIPEPVVWLVASYVDAQNCNAPFVYVEHGAGQSYGGDPTSTSNPSYAGGDGRAWADCRLVVAPGNCAGARHLTARRCPVVLVGCPYLDPWLRKDRSTRLRRGRRVAFAFHWNGSEVSSEARSALAHYEKGLEGAVDDLIGRGWEVWGHGHPREEAGLQAVWHGLDVPWVDRERIFDEADVLVADNTSLIWEFAALGKPVVLLDAPWYRRHVEHGLRFWRWASIGPAVQDAESIPVAVDVAHTDEDPYPQLRQMAVREVYAHVDGRSAQRAATAIMETICG